MDSRPTPNASAATPRTVFIMKLADICIRKELLLFLGLAAVALPCCLMAAVELLLFLGVMAIAEFGSTVGS